MTDEDAAVLQKKVAALQAAVIQKEQQNAQLFEHCKKLQAEIARIAKEADDARKAAGIAQGVLAAHQKHLGDFFAAVKADPDLAANKRAADLAKADAMEAEAKRLRAATNSVQ